ncbi:MAG: hypothetical protein EBZ76_10100, partial [Synechococcaceae bacterium WB9_2_170]|nr:hypothetical protein [Synechococcaceae bacterium WB9_2_170]
SLGPTDGPDRHGKFGERSFDAGVEVELMGGGGGGDPSRLVGERHGDGGGVELEGLGELAGGKRVRLQLVEESPDQLEAPPLP